MCRKTWEIVGDDENDNDDQEDSLGQVAMNHSEAQLNVPMHCRDMRQHRFGAFFP